MVGTRLTLDGWVWRTFGHVDEGWGLGADGYRIMANPYSFAVYVPDDVNRNAIFAASPYIPTEEGFQSAESIVVIYPWLGGSTYWGGAVTVLDGPAESMPGAAHPRMLAVRMPGTTPLTTSRGAPLVTNAWIMYGRNRASTPAVVGKLWDCAMVSDVAADGTVIDGERYRRLAAQSGASGKTRSSLVFRAAGE